MATIVILRNGAAHLDLVERGKRTINDATLTRTMLSDDTVDLKVSSNSVLDIRVNDYFDLFGERYRINQLPTVNKINNSQYEYNIKAQGLMYDLLRCKFFNVDGTGFKTTLDFPLIGDLNLFLTLIKSNMQRFSPLWDIGPVAETETKTLTFGSDTCLSALQKICQEFKTDFWVKSEGGKFKIFTGAFGNTIPVTFEYGKGNGLYSLTRNNVNDEGVINRMYVQGGSENLPNGYRGFSSNLKFSDAGYLEDTALIASMGLKEGELKLDDIYPHRTGKVTALGATKMKFIDNTMDFDLNEKEADGKTTKYLKPDTTAKIHFNTGNLAGYEFEIKKGGYKHGTKEFEIIPQKTETGQQLPDVTSTAFQFAVNDEYVLLDIWAPPSYIVAAEAELLTKATEQFALKKQVQVEYELNVDPEFIKSLITPVSIGDYVRVKDTALAVNKVIRVNSIVRSFIQGGEWQPNNLKLVIADAYEISYASQMVLDIREIKNVNNITNGGQINYSLIGLKTTRELQSMIFDTDGYFDGSNIKPGSIETGMLSVGSQSQQLSCSVIFRVNADGLKNKVVTAAGKLFSQTFNKSWDIPALTYTAPNDNAVYVYAKCSKTGTTASIHYNAAQIKFDEDPNDYYFLLGILHSVVEGMRVLSITVGTTTINGGLIRTGIISSLDGQTTFNLNTGEITGKITFKPGSTGYNNLSDRPDLEALKQAVISAAQSYSDAQDALRKIEAAAYADGKVTEAEQRAINDATNKAEAAKTFAQAQDALLTTQLQAYADGAVDAEEQARITDAQNRLQAAKDYADAQDNLAKVAANAYADGIVDAEEARAIADATAKMEAAKNHAQTLVNNVQIGGRNLLMNFNKWGNEGWTIESPYQISIGTGTRHGILSNQILGDGEFTISFEVVELNGLVRVHNSRGFDVPVILGRNTYSFTASNPRIVFYSGHGSARIKNVKLERGNKATDWTPAPEDVDAAIGTAAQQSATALAQAQNAQQTAAAAQSVTSFLQTTVNGNVVATGSLLVGDAVGANGGISGVTDRGGSSVRFYAGSTYAGKNTAVWLVRDDGVEEQWFKGTLIRQRGVINGVYTEKWYNLNGQLAKLITFSAEGKILEEWYNNGILVYQIGQNGIYYVSEIPESYALTRFLNLNTNVATSDLQTFEGTLREHMWQKTTQPNRYELRGNKDAYLYNAGQNAYSQGNKQYEGYKNTQAKADSLTDGWYAIEQLGDMMQDGINESKRIVRVMRLQAGKVVQTGNTLVETTGYNFNQF